MGAAVGIVLGIAELLKRLSPEQQDQYHAARREFGDLQQKIEDLKAQQKQLEQLGQGNPATFAANMQKFLDKQFEAVAKLPDPPKQPLKSIAIMGKTSAGKTTLINKLFGTNLRTDEIRCTTGVEPVYTAPDESIQCWDVFGDNDEQSYHEIDLLMQAKTLHKLVVVYTDAVDNSLNMAKLVQALRLPTVFFRNKAEDMRPENVDRVRNNDKAQLERVVPQMGPVSLVIGSARTGMGVENLRALF